MRIALTLGILIAMPVAFIVLLWIMTELNDWLDKVFGKPPIPVVVAGVLCWIYVFVVLAWEQAGRWIK